MNTLPPPNVHLTADQAASLLASLRHLHTLHGPCDGATCPHARVIGELEKVVEPEEARKRERIRQQLHDLNGAISYKDYRKTVLGDWVEDEQLPHDPQILADALLRATMGERSGP